jgi:hypothetical protein
MSVIEKPKTYRRGREHRQPIEIVGDPAREILWEAANLLERDGWMQGGYEWDGKHCLVGALHQAEDTYPKTRSKAMLRARKLIAKTLGIKTSRLSRWNDSLDRKKEEVIDALRRASEAPE